MDEIGEEGEKKRVGWGGWVVLSVLRKDFPPLSPHLHPSTHLPPHLHTLVYLT